MSLRVRLSPAIFLLAFGLSAIRVPAQSAPEPPSLNSSLSALADQPASHMGFVFDRSMLQAARSVLESGGMSPNRAAVSLTSMSYDNYRYPRPVEYVPQTMDSIVAAYRAAGWKHLVDGHDRGIYSDNRGTATDLWLHFSGMDIDGVTVLARGDKHMNLIQLVCDLRPMDLIHLSGHFGIPKVDPNAVMVPDPKDR